MFDCFCGVSKAESHLSQMGRPSAVRDSYMCSLQGFCFDEIGVFRQKELMALRWEAVLKACGRDRGSCWTVEVGEDELVKNSSHRPWTVRTCRSCRWIL